MQGDARPLPGSAPGRAASMPAGRWAASSSRARRPMARCSYRIDRLGVIDSMTANPDGDVFTAGGQAGYLFDVGGLRVGPVVGLRYADVDVDAYTEQGDLGADPQCREPRRHQPHRPCRDRGARLARHGRARGAALSVRRGRAGVRRRRAYDPLRAHHRAGDREPVEPAGPIGGVSMGGSPAA